MVKEILKTLKLKHWVKNLVVTVPLIFSMNLGNVSMLLASLRAVLAFCFISSAVYILNDIADIKSDRNHPVKALRPIPSGGISVSFAWVLFGVLLVLSVFTGAFCPLLVWMLFAYLILNILYSYYFKNMPIIDAGCIAFGFILRILAGCFAIAVVPSPLVILLTFFLSLMFTFSKRKLELAALPSDTPKRPSLKDFDTGLLDRFILLNAALSTAFYFTYVLDETTISRAGTEYLYITVIPFALIIFRLLFLVNTVKTTDDPIHFFEGDNTLKVLIFIYCITLLALIIRV